MNKDQPKGPPRLESIFDGDKATSASSSDFTSKAGHLGGLRKTKFTPKIPVRRATPTASKAEQTSKIPPARPDGWKRERGHGREAILSSRGGISTSANISGPVSGPFSQGPSVVAKASRQENSTLASGSNGSGENAGRLRVERFVEKAHIWTHSAENVVDERTIEMKPAIAIEDMFASRESELEPVIIADTDYSDYKSSALGPGKLYLFQMPPVLPQPVAKMEVDPSFAGESAEKPQAMSGFSADVSGKLGKLNIHASGRMSLDIGGVKFDISAGLPPIFYQSAMVFDTEKKIAAELAPCSECTLICVPDLDQLLAL